MTLHTFVAAALLALSAPHIALAQSAAAAGYRDIDDVDVFAASGEKIGDVEDVLINASGQIVAVSVDVSDSFGIGDIEVIVDLDKLRFENARFVTDLNKDQIKALPKWDD